MIKKKGTKKAAEQKSAKKVRKRRPTKKDINPAEVRKQVSQMVQSQAAELTQAVVEEGMKGQVAPVRYLFEMANIFPAQANTEQASEEEDCLAKILLSRMEAPAKPEKEEDDETADEDPEDTVKPPAAAPAASGNSEKKETAEARVGTTTSVT
jgi:hypothetical protein